MAASAVAKAAAQVSKQIVSALFSDKKNQRQSNLVIMVGVPVAFFLVIISGIFTALFYRASDPYDPYIQAVAQVAHTQHIPSTLDGNLVRTIHLLSGQAPSTDTNAIQNFILDYFLTSEEKLTVVDNKIVLAQVPRFKNTEEILARLAMPPFSFNENQLGIVRLFPTVTTGEANPKPGNGMIPIQGATILTGPYPSPCKGYVSSPWGLRLDPLHPGEIAMHNGMDIRGDWHQPIHVIADGVVTKVNTAPSGYGNYVAIRHDTPEFGVFSSLYAHLSRIDVKVGDTVTQGQVIGLEGGEPGKDPNPGDSTGHHLHLEIQVSGPQDTRDPAKYISDKTEQGPEP